jgi:hypothetical protein
VHLARGRRYPRWRVLEFTGEQWRSGRAATYQVLERLGRADLARRVENVWFGMVRHGGTTMASRTGTGVVADALLDAVRDRVAAWTGRPPALAGADPDRLGVALVKYWLLGHPRRSPVEFDPDALWATATAGVGALAAALAWAEGPAPAGPPAPEAPTRALALALAREGAVADRALHQRDPAIVVRHLDEVAAAAAQAARRGAVPEALRAACARVLRRGLDLAVIDLAAPAPGPC